MDLHIIRGLRITIFICRECFTSFHPARIVFIRSVVLACQIIRCGRKPPQLKYRTRQSLRGVAFHMLQHFHTESPAASGTGGVNRFCFFPGTLLPKHFRSICIRKRGLGIVDFISFSGQMRIILDHIMSRILQIVGRYISRSVPNNVINLCFGIIAPLI